MFPEALDPFIDDFLNKWGALQPAIIQIEDAKKLFEILKANCAAPLFIIKHKAQRTRSWEELKAEFNSFKGTTEEAKLINYLCDGRLVNDRLIQAANEMSSVLIVCSSMYSKLDDPTVEEVLERINSLGTVEAIHNQYIADEKAKGARLLAEKQARIRLEKEEKAAARGMTYEQYLKIEKEEAIAAKRDVNKPKRDKLLQDLLEKGEVMMVKMDVPDETVFVMINGSLVKLKHDNGLTMLDAVA